MEVRILLESEIPQAINLAKMVYDCSTRNFLEKTIGSKFFDEYMVEENIISQVRNGELTMWGACHQGVILAVSAMTGTGHITMLYVHPNILRKGYGKVLIKTMKKYAGTKCNLKKVSVNVIPVWMAGYFEKDGFKRQETGYNVNKAYVTMQSKVVTELSYKSRQIPTKVVIGMTIGCLLFLFAGTIGMTICLL